MNIIIVGAGEVGTEIARQLAEEQKNVVLIEKDPAKAKTVAAFLDATVLEGEGTDIDVIRQAGISSADIFIAATTSDEVNLISCMIVSAESNVPVRIARVRNIKYSESSVFSSRLSGVSFLINPEQEAAFEIFQTVEQGAGSTITIFENTDIQLRDYAVDEENYLKGKKVKELRTGLKLDFVITCVVRDGELLIPNGDFTVMEKDQVYIVSRKRTFRKLGPLFGSKNDRINKVLVVGGTHIGESVADMLVSRGRSVTVIDKDYERCKALAADLPEVTVINGDISDHQIYIDENIGAVDAIVTATNNEELNILSGLYAKSLGVKRVVAVVEKTSYITLAGSIGVNSIVSPKFCAINSIVKYVRKGNVNSVHSVFDGKAEAIEAKISEKSPLLGKAIKDMTLPENCLIAAVTRSRKSIIPDGNLELQAGDNVVFFVMRSQIGLLETLIS